MFQDKSTSAARLIDEFRNFFTAIGGAPVKLWSDNSIFPSAEFQDFLRDWDVGWGSSSPYYPQSNGRAEAGIKAIKALVTGSRTGGSFDKNKMTKALLLCRNAPRLGLQSPAQLVFNCPVRDGLPANRRSYAPKWQRDVREIEERSIKAQEKIDIHYNKDASDLPELIVEDHVLLQDPKTKRWFTPGIIVETGNHRDYLVKTPAGRLFRRNRRLIRKRVPVMPGPGPAAALPQATSQPLDAQERSNPARPVQAEQPAESTRPGIGRGRGRRPTLPPPLLPVTRRSSRERAPSSRYPASDWTQ
jgi:hypothetical protein